MTDPGKDFIMAATQEGGISSGTVSQEALAMARKQRTLRYQIGRSRESYLMMAPYFVLFFFFTVLPVLMSIVLSFTNFNMLEAPDFVGWRNYIKLFLEDDIFVIALKNTLLFAVITGPVSYMLCLLFAWIINEFKGFLRAFLTLIFYAPSICGNAYLVWNLILTGDRYGYLNGFLLKLGVINEAILWMQTEKYVLPVLIVVQLWLSLGTGFLSFIAGLQTVDKSMYEAAALDGVKNRWQELWYVTLPAMKPQLMFGAVMQITQSFAVADISINLAGNPSVNYAGATVVTHLLDYGSTRFEMGYASAIATILFLLMVGTNKLVQKILGRVGE
jgi:multiple sugar transport system permease protein